MPRADGLRDGQFANAARLFAEVVAPFPSTESAIYLTPTGAVVICWDAARISALLPKPMRYNAKAIIPETALHVPSEGWRQVACVEGFEAQFWRAGILIASTWRRQPLSRSEWIAFCSEIDAPAPDPFPEAAPLVLGPQTWSRRRLSEPFGWKDAQAASLGVALCAAAAGAVFAGQALRFQQNTPTPTSAPAMRQEVSLKAYAASFPHDAIAAAAVDAMEIAKRFDLRPLSWRIDDETFVMEIDPSGGAPIEAFVLALEASRHLSRVSPKELDGRFRIRAQLEGVKTPTRRKGA